jgi:hypothetical protein
MEFNTKDAIVFVIRTNFNTACSTSSFRAYVHLPAARRPMNDTVYVPAAMKNGRPSHAAPLWIP